MPTGYTATIKDDTTGRDFLLTCARAMGACVMQRDDPMSDPPKEQPASDFYSKALTEARAALDKAVSMGDAEWQAANDEAFRRQSELRAKMRAERDARRATLARVREDVLAWKAPTPEHGGLKAFALEQIGLEADEGSWLDDPIEPIPWRRHREITLQGASLDVVRCAEMAVAERERTETRNAWIRALYASLGGAPESAS